MKAAVLYETHSPLRVEEISIDEPQDQEVLVKLVATGVCHTDLHVIKGDIPIPMPVVLGHEGAGIVEKVGPGVTTLSPGDHVVLMVIFSCGKCRFCATGQPTMCPVGLGAMVMGTMPGGGKRLRKGDQEVSHFFSQSSFAEYAVVHERTAVKIRDDAPFEVACLFGCGVTTGVGAVINTAGIKAGESVVIYGCGGVGLSAIMGAKLAGAGKTIAVDMLDQKLEMAKGFGADYVINASRENPPQRVMELTGGGADYALEFIGNVDVVAQAVSSLRFGGTFVLVGSCPPGSMITISPNDLITGKVLTGCLQGSIVPSVDVPRYIDLYMDGKLPVDKLITRSYGLDGINDAFEAMQKGEVMRSVIRF
jgi:S-(hydroxymethyl)glutathione dehydrogenase/alcohol dehydrogenase